MKIIQPARHTDHARYHRHFDYAGHRGWGFMFACDASGYVDAENLNPAARANWEDCLRGGTESHPVVDRGVQKSEWTSYSPAIGRCDCGAEVELGNFTNTCERCDADYNSAGQRLAPRECWGEETGETASDILLGGGVEW